MYRTCSTFAQKTNVKHASMKWKLILYESYAILYGPYGTTHMSHLYELSESDLRMRYQSVFELLECTLVQLKIINFLNDIDLINNEWNDWSALDFNLIISTSQKENPLGINVYIDGGCDQVIDQV